LKELPHIFSTPSLDRANDQAAMTIIQNHEQTETDQGEKKPMNTSREDDARRNGDEDYGGPQMGNVTRLPNHAIDSPNHDSSTASLPQQGHHVPAKISAGLSSLHPMARHTPILIRKNAGSIAAWDLPSWHLGKRAITYTQYSALLRRANRYQCTRW
jgi:hypothetical protein